MLVSAGAGWGKTAAVAEWAAARRRAGLPVSWVTAGESDTDVAILLRRVLQAFHANRVGLSERQRTIAVDGGLAADATGDLVAALAPTKRPGVLVVDDVEIVDDAVIDQFLAVVHAARIGLTLVLISRSRPIVGLHRARAEGSVHELGIDELAFDADEVRRVALSSGLRIPEAEVSRLLEQTEGWPVAVRLAVLTARPSGSAHDLLSSASRSLTEYLVVEVLGRQPPAVQSFLLTTSVVRRLTPELAEVLVPAVPAGAVLDGLERGNLFVERFATVPPWFRYHPLLRQMLEEQLRQHDPEAHRSAHRAAAEWLAAHEDPVSALDHALTAGDWDLLARLLAEAAAPALVGPGREALRSRLERVPASVLASPGAGAVVGAAKAFAIGALGAVGPATARAREGGEMTASQRILASLLQGAADRARGDGEAAAESAQHALDLLDAGPPFPATDSYRLIARNTRGVGRLWTGRLVAAREDFEWVVNEPTRPDAQMARLYASSSLAMCRLLEGEVDAAIEGSLTTIADAGGRGWSRLLQLRPALAALGWARLLRGELPDCTDTVAGALAASTGGVEPPPTQLVWAIKASAEATGGRPRAARTSLEQIRDLPPATGWVRAEVVRAQTAAAVGARDVHLAQELLTTELEVPANDPVLLACRARLLTCLGASAAAVDAARTALATDAETLPETVAHVEAALVLATAAWRGHRTYEAVQTVRTACESARDAGLVQPFLAAPGPEVTQALRLLREGSGQPDDFVARLLNLVDRHGTPAAPVRQLTERELEVLMALARMRSNSEIAQDLMVSENTVKAHLKSVYGKLGVDNRRAAVRTARGVGLLP